MDNPEASADEKIYNDEDMWSKVGEIVEDGRWEQSRMAVISSPSTHEPLN
jgi:hypothetical protein